jgi:hypothetical protein
MQATPVSMAQFLKSPAGAAFTVSGQAALVNAANQSAANAAALRAAYASVNQANAGGQPTIAGYTLG